MAGIKGRNHDSRAAFVAFPMRSQITMGGWGLQRLRSAKSSSLVRMAARFCNAYCQISESLASLNPISPDGDGVVACLSERNGQ